MKIVIRTFIFHFLSILLFGLVYFFFESHFVRDKIYTVNKNNRPEMIDCFFLATTIQCGVGYSDLYPITNLAKMILIIQQFTMISTNILLLYVLTSKELRSFYK
jgi:hypothetical protein